ALAGPVATTRATRAAREVMLFMRATLQRFAQVNIVAVYVVKLYSLYINGEFVSSERSAALDVIDPSTGDVIARVPDASAAEVGKAVAAARAAFDTGPWKDTTAQDRGRVLFKLAEIVRHRADELAELETRNTGKP